MKRRLAWVCLAFALAAAAAGMLPAAVVLLPAAGLAVFAVLRRRNGRPAGLFAAMAAAVCAAALWQNLYTAAHSRAAAAWDGQTAVLQVTVDSAVPAYGDMAYGTLTVTEAGEQNIHMKLVCYGFPYTEPGQRFRAEFTLSALGPDSRDDFAGGVFCQGEYKGGYRALGPAPGVGARFAALRMALSRRLAALLPPDESALASAMVLGDKSCLTPEHKRVFAGAGASHMLVVSGLHLSMLCGLLTVPLRRRPFSRLRAAAVLAVCFFMAGLVGFTVSVLRAAVVLAISQLGILLYRPPDSLTSLAAAAALLCLHNPYAMYDIGFQLSFAATLGMLAAAGAARVLYRPGRRSSLLRRGAQAVADAILAGTMASLFTAPFLLWHRMAVSGVTMFSSVLAMLLLPPVLALGTAAALAAMLPVPAVCGVFALPLGFLLWLLCGALTLLGRLPFARLSLPREYTILALAVLGAAALCLAKWQRPPRAAAALVLLAVTAVGLGAAFGRDVVELEVFGTANAPCIFARQNGESALVFRGGRGNLARLQQAMDRCGADAFTVIIDLRGSASGELPPCGQRIEASQLTDSATGRALPDLAYAVRPQKDGTAVLLDAGGWRIGLSAGKVTENLAVPVDVYLSAGRVPRQFRPGQVLTPGGSTAVLAVRPGRSMQIKGGDGFDIS